MPAAFVVRGGERETHAIAGSISRNCIFTGQGRTTADDYDGRSKQLEGTAAPLRLGRPRPNAGTGRTPGVVPAVAVIRFYPPLSCKNAVAHVPHAATVALVRADRLLPREADNQVAEEALRRLDRVRMICV